METAAPQSSRHRRSPPPAIGGGAKYKRWRLEDGKPITLRILPPLKSLVASDAYTDFWRQHCLTTQDPGDPKRPIYHFILSVEESHWSNRQLIIDTPDPLVELREPIAARDKAIRSLGEEQKKTKDEIRAACKDTNDFLRSHGYDGKWRFYAVDREGNYGILELSNTTKKDLLAKAQEYQRNNDDKNPFWHDTGVFWVFSRSGKTFPIKDDVQIFQTPVVVNGKTYQEVAIHNFTEEMEAAALKVLPDFEDLKEQIRYPRHVLQDLADCDQDPQTINAIMAEAKKVKAAEAEAKRKAAVGAVVGTSVSSEKAVEKILATDPFAGLTPDKIAAVAAEDEDVGEPGESAEETAVPLTGVAATAVASTVAPETAEEDEETALLRQLAEAKARKAAKTAAPVTAASPEKASEPATPVVPAEGKKSFKDLFPKKTRPASTTTA